MEETQQQYKPMIVRWNYSGLVILNLHKLLTFHRYEYRTRTGKFMASKSRKLRWGREKEENCLMEEKGRKNMKTREFDARKHVIWKILQEETTS